MWRSTGESTGGGWAGHRLLLPETSAVSCLPHRATLVVKKKKKVETDKMTLWKRKQWNEGSGDTTRERAQHLMEVEEVTYDWLVYYYIEIDSYCNRTYGCKTFFFFFFWCDNVFLRHTFLHIVQFLWKRWHAGGVVYYIICDCSSWSIKILLNLASNTGVLWTTCAALYLDLYWKSLSFSSLIRALPQDRLWSLTQNTSNRACITNWKFTRQWGSHGKMLCCIMGNVGSSNFWK